MKKTVLFLTAMGAMGMTYAQRASQALPLAGPIHARTYTKPIADQQFSEVYTQNSSVHRNGPSTVLSTNETVIGNTMYPLQTNSSVYRRTHYNAGGTVSATWILSTGTWNTWADRGTGYNFYNGTTWGAIPTVRIENARTGFSDLGVTDGGAEVVVGHNTTAVAQHFATRPVAGTGAWTDNTSLISNPPGFSAGQTLWPRIAVGGTNGDVIHHIVVTEPVANGGSTYHGQDGCLMYSRSNDGGATFATQNVLLAAFDSTQTLGVGGDSYAIDAHGDVVAIVMGGFGEDVVLAKSTDGGNTWTKTIVQDFAMPAPYDGVAMTDAYDTNGDPNPDGIADTLETNDASLSVLIDNNNMVHVFFGDMYVLSDGTALSYFPGTAALMYWNENMAPGAPVFVAGAEDLNSNGVLDVSDFGTYQVSLVSHPTTGIDAAGNLYVAFSSIMEGTDDGTGKSFRNIYAMSSSDNGTTWTTPYNVAPDLLSEKVYPSMTREVAGGIIRMTYQVDQVAGHGVGSTNPDADNQGVSCDIVYAEVNVNDLQIGVQEHNMSFSSVNVYPNPANNTAAVSINMTKAQEVTISVYNSTGQLVSSEQQQLSAGTSTLPLEVSSLAPGIYFVNVQEGTSMISKKLIIE